MRYDIRLFQTPCAEIQLKSVLLESYVWLYTIYTIKTSLYRHFAITRAHFEVVPCSDIYHLQTRILERIQRRLQS
jgi:hypothetical protein